MNTEKFSGKAKLYEKYRPVYPEALMEYLYCEVGLNKSSTIADVGAGTGLFTGQLLEKGSKVFGVEPNKDMRASAKSYLKKFDNFIPVDGTAEATKLEDSSVDFVTVAQAFHWFDAAAFRKECIRVLKPAGLVVLVWNSRVAQAAVVAENAAVCKRFCPDFKGFSGGIDERPSEFSLFYRNGLYTAKKLDYNISYDLEGYIGRNLSASYAPEAKDACYHEFINSLTELFYKYAHGGELVIPHITRCYTGKV